MRMTFGLAVLLSACLPFGSALAHVDHEHASGDAELPWSFEPWVLVCLAVALVWYAIGAWRSRHEGVKTIGCYHIAAFIGGIGFLFAALVSPIDPLGVKLFSVHMVQHLLLMMAAPPLLVASQPAIAFLWAFPSRSRKAIGRMWAAAGLTRGFALLMHPVLVWSFFTGSFVLWHIPAMYQWALSDEGVHTLEHASFFVTSLAFWTIVIEPSGRRRLDYGSTLLFVSTTAVLSGLPGALMIFAPRPLYPAHAAGVADWGLTLMQDQQLAGLIMWIPAGLVYVIAAGWLFVVWMNEAERRAIRALPGQALAISLLLVVGLILSGCDYAPSANASIPHAPGDPLRGAQLIQRFGCGGCHIIPGVTGANGLVGPPLTKMGRRVYIAGVLRNSPSNMALWIEHPQAIVPGNAMPEMAISHADSRDITAYLYTLK